MRNLALLSFSILVITMAALPANAYTNMIVTFSQGQVGVIADMQ